MPAGLECLAVAAAEHDTAATERVNVAPQQPVVTATVDHHAAAAHPAHRAGVKQAMFAAVDVDRIRGAAFPRDSVEGDVRDVLQFQHGEGGRGEFEPRGSGIGRWPEPNPARGRVEIPFARLIEFGERMDRPEPLAGAEAVFVPRFGERDAVICGVHRLELLVGFRPIPKPVAVQPRLWITRPTGGDLALIDEGAGFGTLDAVTFQRIVGVHRGDHHALGRTGSHRHRLAVETQLGQRVRVETATAAKPAQSQRGQLEVRRQLDRDHLGAGRRGQARVRLRCRNPAKRERAGDHRLGPRQRADCQRVARRSGIAFF